MKKGIAAVALSLALAFAVAGCAKKATVNIAIEGVGDCELVEVPSGTVNTSANENVITTTLSKDGDYVFGVKGDDGERFSVTVSYADGKASVSTDADAEVQASIS